MSGTKSAFNLYGLKHKRYAVCKIKQYYSKTAWIPKSFTNTMTATILNRKAKNNKL